MLRSSHCHGAKAPHLIRGDLSSLGPPRPLYGRSATFLGGPWRGRLFADCPKLLPHVPS